MSGGGKQDIAKKRKNGISRRVLARFWRRLARCKSPWSFECDEKGIEANGVIEKKLEGKK